MKIINTYKIKIIIMRIILDHKIEKQAIIMKKQA